MATMIPSVISPEVKSSAERRIFDWFEKAPQTDDWIVLHSLGISTHNRVIYGETDFFVLAPRLGLFSLEVKGGRVKRENGLWYFTNRYGKTNSKARGPFDQAKESAFNIVTALKKRIDSNHRHLSNVFFGFGVMLPDIEYAASGIDEEQWQVFDARDGRDVKGFVTRLADESHKQWESVYGYLDKTRLPSAEDICYLASVLRGDFDCAVSIGVQYRNADDALIRLTREQYRCLDQLDDNPRCLIQGPAGSGKTLLAIEEVKKSAAKGKRTALFCFNSNLADWFSYYFKNLPQDLRPTFVGTFHSFMKHITKEAGVDPDYPCDSDDVQQYYQETLPMATSTALHLTGAPYDKIIVDEAQDLIRDSYLNVLDRCLSKGLQRGSWTMFGDFSMQAIYIDQLSGPEMIEKLDDITAFIRFKLTLNCRNTILNNSNDDIDEINDSIFETKRQSCALSSGPVEDLKAYCMNMKMSYSYKPILIMAMLSASDKNWEIHIFEAAEYIKAFYRSRRDRGLQVERKKCIYQNPGVTIDQIISNLIANPVKALIESGYFEYNSENGVFSLVNDIKKMMTTKSASDLFDICNQRLTQYYER